MCTLCDEGKPQDHTASLHGSRRDFLKASTATAVAAAGLNVLSASPATAEPPSEYPTDTGEHRRSYGIRGGIGLMCHTGRRVYLSGGELVQERRLDSALRDV